MICITDEFHPGPALTTGDTGLPIEMYGLPTLLLWFSLAWKFDGISLISQGCREGRFQTTWRISPCYLFPTSCRTIQPMLNDNQQCRELTYSIIIFPWSRRSWIGTVQRAAAARAGRQVTGQTTHESASVALSGSPPLGGAFSTCSNWKIKITNLVITKKKL